MADDLVFCPFSMQMTTKAERQKWVDHYNELAFQRAPRQGEMAAPMIISDSLGVHGVQSMLDGKMYDSKSELRKTYRQAGVVEVGNDSSVLDKDKVDNHNRRRKMQTRHEKDLNRKQVQHAVRSAISRNNLTRHRKDEVKVG